MALTTVSQHVVSVNAIQGTLIADNAITAVHIATNAVSGTLIADNAVTATHIAQNTITVTQLADDAVEADKIADGVITTNHLNKAMISSQTEVTPVAGDFVLIGDTSDSNNLKKTPISGITALATIAGISSSADATAMTIDSNEKIIIGDTQSSAADDLLQIETPASGGGHGIQIRRNDSNNDQGIGRIMFGNNTDIDLATISAITDGSTDNARLVFYTQPNGGSSTERMRIDSIGDVTVGTSSLGFHFDVSTQTFSTKFGTGGNLTLAVTNSSGTGVGGEIFLGGSTRGDALKNCIVFRNASNSEKMRMAENGSFHIGTGGGEANGSTGGASFSTDNNDRKNFICATTGTGNLELIEFRNPNGTVGTIKSNGSGTSYNTSSDYRLKENVEYTWDATSRLKQLKPARFNFKVDADTTLDGFLAHEVSSIVPEAISGEKDGEKMQSIDHSKLVPLLVKTIQELEARIATLEG